MEWPACLESIFNLDPGCWDSETFGKYGVTIDDKNVKMKIDISQSGVSISGDSSHEDTCVSVNISSSDLAGILKGSLPPLQAYLTGRITTQVRAFGSGFQVLWLLFIIRIEILICR